MIFNQLKTIYYLKSQQVGIASLKPGNFLLIQPDLKSRNKLGTEGTLTTIINRINSYQWK